MKEVEIKIKDIDKQKIIEKLEDLGAKKNFVGRVVDYRFDTPGRVLSKQGKALRIRKKGNHVYLALKGKISAFQNITSRDEIGVRMSNFSTMYRILNELSFIKIFETDRYRYQYRLDDVTFDIDCYKGMDPLLEIEGKDHETVKKYVRVLGLEDKRHSRVFIKEILEARKEYLEKKKKLKFKNSEEML